MKTALFGFFCLVACIAWAAQTAWAADGRTWKMVDFSLEKHAAERKITLDINHVNPQKFYHKDFELELYIALEDMNGDGVPEIFALFRHPDFCGTHACEFQTLQRTRDGDWKSVTNMGTNSTAMALGPYHNGYRDILFHGGGPGSMRDLSCPVWQYNGSEYNLKYMMLLDGWPCREVNALFFNEK